MSDIGLLTCGIWKSVTVRGTDGRRRLGQLFVGVMKAVTAAVQSAWNRLKIVDVHRQLVTT